MDCQLSKFSIYNNPIAFVICAIKITYLLLIQNTNDNGANHVLLIVLIFVDLSCVHAARLTDCLSVVAFVVKETFHVYVLFANTDSFVLFCNDR